MVAHQPLAPTSAPKSVIVVGAGPAGLTCAYQLVQAGHHVTVLEARDRPGGRVWTLRAPLPDGLLAEVGATILPDNHPLPLHYAAAFGLPLIALPVTGPPPRYRVGGVPVPHPTPPATDAPAPNPLALLMRTIRALVARHGDWPPPTGTAGVWEPLDHLSLAELLRREGLSEEVRGLVPLTLLGNFGEGIETVSALAAVRQLALQQGRGRSFLVAGGNDRLAWAFADRLGKRVCFRSEVVGLSQDATGVLVRLRGPAGEGAALAERVIVAVPTPALARLTVSPPWRAARAAALRRQRWTPVTRIFLTVERRFWDPGRSALLAASDRPTVRWMVGPTAAVEHDVLTAYVTGVAARELASVTAEGRAAWARAEAARVFPEWNEAASAQAWSHCWDQDPFAGGGYPWPAPGDEPLPEVLATPEGRVHFAGEQTTHQFGWLQGAMESGLRAAREVDAAP
jgi:monoamine oxidase